VRVIGVEGNQLGILTLTDALEEAGKSGLDLVEVAPGSSPPVCRIMDYGKYLYKRSKKLQEAREGAISVQLKEVRIRPKIEEHDMQFKFRQIRKFLDQSNKVKITMIFRGREMRHTDIGRNIMDEIKSRLGDTCVIDVYPRLEGRNMVMIVSTEKK
jgi:bacterial translation initiation factor 3 (bIF-3)